MDISIIPQIILILVLTGINAFFASAEMAIVSVDKLKVQDKADQGEMKAKALLEIIKQPNKFLSTIQVGITLAGFFSSASAATGLAAGFGIYLDGIGVPFANQIALVAITILLSYFILVFGEVFPKRIALCNALEVAMFSVGPLNIISKITAPFVAILTISISGLLKVFKIKQEETEEKITEEKIRLLLKKGAMDGGIKAIEEQRIHRIFEFDNQLVKEVMVPKGEAFMINMEQEVEELIGELAKAKHSRIPVYQGDVNNVIGTILLKDIFELREQRGKVTTKDLEELLYSPIIVSENDIVDQLFLRLQKSKKHMAIVMSDRGKFQGIITLEDMIEEIFGNIDDEFDV